MVTEAVVRDIHLNAYVNVAMDDVLERFRNGEAAELLLAAIDAARPLLGDEVVSVHATSPEKTSNRVARMVVSWQLTDDHGGTREGSGSISFVVVQSGHDPMTEIVVTLPVTDEDAGSFVALTRRFLDDLADRLTTPAG